MWLRAHSGCSAFVGVASYTAERINSSGSDPVTAVIFQLIYRSRSSFDGKYVVVWLVTKLPVFSVEPNDHCRIHKTAPLGPVLCVLNAVRSVEWPAFGGNFLSDFFRISTSECGLLAEVFKAVINLQLLWNVWSFLTSSAAVNLSRRTFLLGICWFQNHNFACCFAWVQNLVSHIERGT